MKFLGLFNLFNYSAVKVFKHTFSHATLPVCLINREGKIIWQNKFFQQQFSNVGIRSNFDATFKPKQVLKKVQVLYGNGAWAIAHIKIGSMFGITFQSLRKESIDWWNALPFPIGVLDQQNRIETYNESLSNLLVHGYEDALIPITQFAPQFDPHKAMSDQGQELIWHSNFGVMPILTWVKQYGDKKLLVLENRAEFIKLKNKAQEAQHLQVMGQLASGIIHDFNNLLTAIGGFSELLESTIPDNEMLTEIQRNTEQAATLAQELLNFVKEKPVEQKLTNLSSFLIGRNMMLQKLLGPNIRLEISAKLDGLVELSQTQLEQIILNMALNSRDAMNNTGVLKILQYKKSLLVRTHINHTVLEPGQYFIIEIADNGPGISAENLQKIFSPFFSTKEKGTGLGLSSCLRIVQHASGTIDVRTSSLGTQFYIYLPISQHASIEEEKITKEEAQIIPFVKKTLILAEDEEVIRQLVQKALTQEGYIVHAYSNGIDALDGVKKYHADGLITDAVLPGIDGITLANRVRAMNQDIKILVVSGYGIDDLAPNMDTSTSYLAKPFTLKALKEKVNSTFQG